MRLGEALAAGLGAASQAVTCARDLTRRLAAGVEPTLRRVAGPFVHPPPEPRLVEARRPSLGPQADVEEAKYYLGPTRGSRRPDPAPGQFVDREIGELPRAYGEDRIALLPRDPWWVFAYWEVTPTTRVEALRTLGAEAEDAREILRVYDVTFITFTGDNAWLSFDVELTPGAGSWYLNVGRPAASYCVEIGLRTAAGRFLPLARSNTVTTPRVGPSPDTTVRWVEFRREGAVRDTPHVWSGEVVNGGAPEGELEADVPRSSDVHVPPR